MTVTWAAMRWVLEVVGAGGWMELGAGEEMRENALSRRAGCAAVKGADAGALPGHSFCCCLSSLLASPNPVNDQLQDEDAEAKARRLSWRLGLQQDEEEQEEQAATERQQRAGAPAGAAASAAAAAAAAAGRGAVAVTDGPINVDLPTKRRGSKGGAAAAAASQQQQQGSGSVLEAVKQQRGSVAGQDWLFSALPTAAGGSAAKKGKAAAAAGDVSIGPATAAERQQNGAAPPAAAAQADGAEPAAQAAFVKSKAFQGARPGYVFKKGPQGERGTFTQLLLAPLGCRCHSRHCCCCCSCHLHPYCLPSRARCSRCRCLTARLSCLRACHLLLQVWAITWMAQRPCVLQKLPANANAPRPQRRDGARSSSSRAWAAAGQRARTRVT